MVIGVPASPSAEPPEAGGKGAPPSAALDAPALALDDDVPASAQP
jgi:hypothetical protein